MHLPDLKKKSMTCVMIALPVDGGVGGEDNEVVLCVQFLSEHLLRLIS
jgi:hypothetical protein